MAMAADETGDERQGSVAILADEVERALRSHGVI
jgi:hypothetical protein